MKIVESDVFLSSSHSKEHSIQERESLQMWNKPEDAPERLRQGDRLELTEKFKHLHKDKTTEKLNNELSDVAYDPKLMKIIRALEVLTGKKINLAKFAKLDPSEVQGQISKDSTVEPQERLGWGIDYSYEKTEIKKESLQFSAHGSIKTGDGKNIDFSLALSLKNESQTHESISIKAGDALIDPLVINFGSSSVNIAHVKHDFDLNLDGRSDTFSFVGSGSGFFALDKNKDGIINDGSELFGPTLGNGFEELARYDKDGNDWIDENDEIFDELIIWTKDNTGNENLYKLIDKNIGAIYLGAIDTQFALKNHEGNLQAQMKESSIYLKEDGDVGTVQEIDLVV